MKRYILLALLIFITNTLIACGGSSGGSSPDTTATNPLAKYAGSYFNALAPTETLTVDANGNFSDSYCGYDGSFTKPDSSTYISVITIRGTNGTAGCLSSTDHVCTVNLVEPYLQLDCGAPHQYSFQRN